MTPRTSSTQVRRRTSSSASARQASHQSVDQRRRRGPFDIIGDVHGCREELEDLLAQLGYEFSLRSGWRSPLGRTAVFVGDLVDRGPDGAGTVRLVMRMVERGAALAVPGNHDLQLERHLSGEAVPLLYGLEATAAEFAREPVAFRRAVVRFFRSLPGHLVLDEGRLVVAHAGLETALHGVDTPEARRLAAYGLPLDDLAQHDPVRRRAWVDSYRGEALLVYGHTPVSEVSWQGQTVDIDTGCVYGGRLTAFRWPERELVSVPARRLHAPRRTGPPQG